LYEFSRDGLIGRQQIVGFNACKIELQLRAIKNQIRKKKRGKTIKNQTKWDKRAIINQTGKSRAEKTGNHGW
jgi:hypothetical protein